MMGESLGEGKSTNKWRKDDLNYLRSSQQLRSVPIVPFLIDKKRKEMVKHRNSINAQK